MSVENKEEKLVRKYFEGLKYTSIKLDQNQTIKLPDYLFVRGALWFLAEVKNLEEQDEFVRGFAVKEKVRTTLNGMKLSYNLGFDIYDGILEQDIRKIDVERCVRDNLASPDVLQRKSFELTGKIRFRINDISQTGRKAIHFGIYGLAKESDGAKRIRSDIKSAVSKYKKLRHELPYVLIILPKRVTFDEYDLMVGMFGDIIVHISIQSGDVMGGSRRNSALQAGKNTSISAVAAYVDGRFKVIHNPHRAIELPYEVFNQNENMQYYVIDKSGEIESR